MHFRHLLVPLFVIPFFAACAAPSSEEEGELEESTESELNARTCEIGVSCARSLTLLPAIDHGTRPPARYRSDIEIDQTTWPRTPRVLRQLTTGRMIARGDASLTLRAFSVDNLVLFEVLDAANGARIDAAFAGSVGGAPVKLSGVPVKRLGVDAFTFAAGAIDLGSILPKERAFRLRVSALDNGDRAYVTDVVADATVALPTYVLAGNPEGTAPFVVDDDVVVRVNGTEVHRSRNGYEAHAPVAFKAKKGDALEVDLFDTYGVCLQNADVWLSGPGIAATRVIWATPERCGTQASPTTPFATVDIAIGAEGPPPPAPVATDRTQSVLKNNSSPVGRDFTAALERWTVKQRYDMNYGFPFFKMLVYGFNLEAPTHAAFANETNHFNIVPQGEVSRASLDGIVSWWQPKIDDLRTRVTADHASGLITTRDRDAKIAVLNALQAILDGSVKPLRATFDKYPDVAKVKLDLR